MNITIRIVSLLIILTGFLLQVNGQDLPVTCGGSRVRYGTSGLPNSMFDWEVQGGSIINNYNDSVDVQWGTEPGTKSIKVTEHTVYHCIGSPTVASIKIDVPKFSISKFNYVCLGQTIIMDPGSDFTTYLWNTGDVTRTITASSSGLYKLQVTDENGCVASDSVYLSVIALPKVYLGRDTDLCTQQTMTLDAGTDGSLFKWSTGEVTQTIQINGGTQTIFVEVENGFGCKNSDTIQIHPCMVYNGETPPNAFTPNGDGDNDTWRIRGLEDRDNVSIEIFDRWGRRVFQSKHGLPKGGWDGTFNGRNLPMDSYYYIIKLENGTTLKPGTVTIIR